MLSLFFKDGKTQTINVHKVKVDDMGVAYKDPEIGIPTKIFHSKLKGFKLDVDVTPAIEATSVAHQKEFSSTGPRARIPHSEA